MTRTPFDSTALAPFAALRDRLSSQARAAELARKPDDDCIAAVEATVLFSALVPRAHGGAELDLADVFDAVTLLAEGCTSTAWVASFYVAHSWIASLFPAAAREEFFAERPFIRAPAPFAPTGTARVETTGYRLSGRWRWATGCMHADWVFVAALCQAEGLPPEARLFALPAADARVVDTWNVSGMAATGSHDLIVEDAFVPAHRTLAFEAFKNGDTPGARDHTSALYRTPMPPLLAYTAALPALGAARGAVRSFEKTMKARYLAYENKHQDERPASQMRLARADASVAAAELLLRDAVARIGRGTGGSGLDMLERSAIRMRCAHAVALCREAIRGLVEAAGSSACFLDHPLQRLARDVDVLSTHVIFDWDSTSEARGRVMLGRKPGTLLI